MQQSKWIIVLTSLVGVAALTGLILHAKEQRVRKKRRKEIKARLEDKTWSSENIIFDESLITEQLTRNISFLGEDRMMRLRKSRVVVVGLGGVGSHAAHMLLRSGVEHLKLVDFDQVSLSSLNRHAVATHEDVGTAKVVAMKRHLLEIAPWAQIEACNQLFNGEKAQDLIFGQIEPMAPDFVLDCIDNLQTKVDLIVFCKKHDIPIISSMGAGAKCNPSKITIADISDTSEDALARATRHALKRKGISSNVPVVFSLENPGPVGLLPIDPTLLDEAKEFAPLPDFRSRILPVLGTLPAMFGMAMASYVVAKITEWPHFPETRVVKSGKNFHSKLVRDFASRHPNKAIGSKDAARLMDEVWQGRSCISGLTENLCLTLWDSTEPVSLYNIILVTKSEAEKHDREIIAKYPLEIVKTIQAILSQEKQRLTMSIS